MPDKIIRCPWGDTGDALTREYHDTFWGKACFDERTLFEMLMLDGAQAGLSWSTILHKRESYRVAFDDWDIIKIAAYDDAKVSELLQNSGIIRNKLKVNAVITNARAVLKLGSLRDFIWGYVGGKPIINRWRTQEEIPATTELSDRISNDMKPKFPNDLHYTKKNPIGKSLKNLLIFLRERDIIQDRICIICTSVNTRPYFSRSGGCSLFLLLFSFFFHVFFDSFYNVIL